MAGEITDTQAAAIQATASQLRQLRDRLNPPPAALPPESAATTSEKKRSGVPRTGDEALLPASDSTSSQPVEGATRSADGFGMRAIGKKLADLTVARPRVEVEATIAQALELLRTNSTLPGPALRVADVIANPGLVDAYYGKSKWNNAEAAGDLNYLRSAIKIAVYQLKNPDNNR